MRLIIIAGMPATGKSWIAGILRERFGYPVIEKDRIKERLFDTVGYEDYAGKRTLDTAASTIMLDMVRKFLDAGQSLIIDNNFDEISAPELGKLLEEYPEADVTTVFMTGDPEVLYERYFARDAAHQRHLGHCMQTHYPPHEGESTEFHMTREGFDERFIRRHNDVMSWGGRRIDVDATDFAKVDWEALVRALAGEEEDMKDYMRPAALSAEDREKVIQKIVQKKVIAIVRGVFGGDARKLAQALHAGGVDLLEVTFDQSSEEKREKTVETIRLLVDELGAEMCFGAGTVTSVEMVRRARSAGAQFIISPNTDEVVIRETRALGMVSIPGALTPSEIFDASRAGGDFIKVFPADAVGPAYFKALLTPLNNVRLLAVGGVNPSNIRDYLAAGASGAGLASCLFKKEWIAQGAWERVTEAAKALVSEVERKE